MPRADEALVATRLGDSPPALPFRKPFDLTPWQLSFGVLSLGLAASIDSMFPLSDVPFREDGIVSPLTVARMVIFGVGALLAFIQPADRTLPIWGFVAVRHFVRGMQARFPGWPEESERGQRYFDADAQDMTRMRLTGDGLVFIVEPPFWGLVKRTPAAAGYWKRHVPYRMLLPVEPQGQLELMTDEERASRWHGWGAGMKALEWPIQVVVQTLPEDPDWLAERASPPAHSPFTRFWASIDRWARMKALTLIRRRVVVACSAPSMAELTEHVRHVQSMLEEAGVWVRELDALEQHDLFQSVWGCRRFYPWSTDSFGVGDVDYVTITVRRFPRNCVVGWLSYVIGQLPVDAGLFIEPDDGAWVPKIKDWFEGMCELATADTAHRDAYADLARIEGRLKRTEDSVQRATLLLTMPKEIVPRLTKRLETAGAVVSQTKYEHEAGRMASMPIGGVPRTGVTRPYGGEDVAACYPFGDAGLRTRGVLLGTARNSNQAVTLDLLDPALMAAMVAILGTTGAGKTFFMQLLLLRSGLPFVVIDMKPHLDERRHGDFYPLIREAQEHGRGGHYHVCKAGEPIPPAHPLAQAYNLASVADADKPEILRQIGELTWDHAVDTLEDMIFAIDEAYWLGKTEAGQEFIERIVSQGRSVGLIGVCASQELSDFLSNRRMAKAVTMSSVQVVLAQEKSMINPVADTLNLEGAARKELAKFQPAPGDTVAASTRSAIMRVGQRMVSFRIEASPEEQALFTTKPSDKRARREAREEVLV
jgi:hypothetical protein